MIKAIETRLKETDTSLNTDKIWADALAKQPRLADSVLREHDVEGQSDSMFELGTELFKLGGGGGDPQAFTKFNQMCQMFLSMFNEKGRSMVGNLSDKKDF